MIRFFLVTFLFATILGCSSIELVELEATKIAINDTIDDDDDEIDDIIEPFREELEEEMEEVIAVAENDFIVERPSGNLNNWAADATLNSIKGDERIDAPLIALLNKGGLRTTINKGEVTIGDIFKVMPFDNEVICVKLPISSITKIEAYLQKSGGEPIGGAKIIDGKLVFDEVMQDANYFWIVTSDYLYNGGDNMNFFKDAVDTFYIGSLLRDVFIQEAKNQSTLINNTENRMQF